MRVLLVTNLYPNPLQPDRATFNRQQFEKVAAQHALAVISPIAWTEKLRCRLGSGRRSVAKQLARNGPDGVQVTHPTYLFPPRILRNWYGHFFRKSIKPAFNHALVEFKPDIVVGSWAYPDGWAAVDLGHSAGLPVVIKVHGSDVLTLPDHSARMTRTIEALMRADGIIAVSGDLSRKIVSFGIDPGKVRVIYNGVDTQLFFPGPRRDARALLDLDQAVPIVLYIGNLVPVKGVDVLIEACGLLASEGLRFACYLVGQGALRQSLGRRVCSLGLEDQVHLVGPKAHSELPNWFRAADLLVLPSRSEGSPNVLLEASACGVPFVASRVGGISEMLHLGDGALVPPDDPRALAAAIKQRIVRAPGLTKPVACRFRDHADAARELIGFLDEVRARYLQDRFKMA